MNKSLKIYLGVLVLLFVLLVIIDFTTPDPVDWSRTYNENHKKPYGTYILRRELDSIFTDAEINDVNITPYEFFDDYYDWEEEEYTTHGTYINIGEQLDIDELSAQELLDFSSHGNTVFISSNDFPKKFLDSLYLDVGYNFYGNRKVKYSFENEALKNNEIEIEKGTNYRYFNELDENYTTILGYQEVDSVRQVNFIKVDYFDGEILLHLKPEVFTNYYLLKDDRRKYVAGVLSYVQDSTLFYDIKSKRGTELGDSDLRFILSNPSLKMAYYLAILSLIVFIIFNAKRKQRIVKIIKPEENTTVAFTKTIGNLYFETKDHNNIIEKKITFFLEFIRRNYYLDTQILDEKFVKSLATKSGVALEKVQKVINIVVYLKSKPICTEENLLQLNSAIEDFYKTE